MLAPKIILPQVGQHTTWRLSSVRCFSQRNERFVPYIRYLSTWTRHQRDEPPIIWLRKLMGQHLRRPKGYNKLRFSFERTCFLTPGSSAKAEI